MSLLTPRVEYAPFEYPQAYDYWLQQQQVHWLPGEINITGDVTDWNQNLTQAEKNTVGHILKSFAQAEVFIEDYWASSVGRWFKKPEIQMMAHAFAGMESIHAVSYALLNQTLGLENFTEFLQDKSSKDKIDRLINTTGKSKKDIARSLAVFSAFNEGVNLFSSFAILLNFKRFNKLKGVGTIVEFSCRDESLHSNAGVWLFNTLKAEFPEIWDDELKKDIYDAARLTVQLEDSYIDAAFAFGDIEGLTVKGLKAFIRHRTNTKLVDMGLKTNWKNVNYLDVKQITDFMDPFMSGTQLSDFFAVRSSGYSKSVISFDNVWGGGV